MGGGFQKTLTTKDTENLEGARRDGDVPDDEAPPMVLEAEEVIISTIDKLPTGNRVPRQLDFPAP